MTLIRTCTSTTSQEIASMFQICSFLRLNHCRCLVIDMFQANLFQFFSFPMFGHSINIPPYCASTSVSYYSSVSELHDSFNVSVTYIPTLPTKSIWPQMFATAAKHRVPLDKKSGSVFTTDSSPQKRKQKYIHPLGGTYDSRNQDFLWRSEINILPSPKHQLYSIKISYSIFGTFIKRVVGHYSAFNLLTLL